MAVTLNLQDDTGTTDDANTYNTVATFKAFCDNRGYDYSTFTDDEIGQALIRATDYIDTRFFFRGIKLTSTQTTEFPREDLVDRDGNDVTGVPGPVKKAHNVYTFKALDTALYEDAPAPDGGRPVIQESITTGPITTNQTFVSPQIMTIVLGEFPEADRILITAGYVQSRLQGTMDR